MGKSTMQDSAWRYPAFLNPNSARQLFSRSQGVSSDARRSAKAEVRGANPRESASFLVAPVPQQLQERLRKPLFVGASPTGGPTENFKHQTPNFKLGSGLWCNSSISPCEGDGPGANPGFLTKVWFFALFSSVNPVKPC